MCIFMLFAGVGKCVVQPVNNNILAWLSCHTTERKAQTLCPGIIYWKLLSSNLFLEAVIPCFL